MKKQPYILFALFLVACSINNSSQPLPSTIADSLPPPASTGTPGNGTISLPNGVTGYTTTTGGYFTINSVSTFTLASNQTLKGMSADSSKLYPLIFRGAGNGVNYWDFETGSLGGTSFSKVCSILDDGKFSNGIAADGSSFYTYYGSDGVSQLRQFSRTSCAEGSKTTITSSSYYIYESPDLALDQGNFYFLPGTTGSGSISALGQYNLSSTAFNTFSIFNLSLAGAELGENGSYDNETLNVAVGSGTIWILRSINSGQICGVGATAPLVLWKLSVSGSQVQAVGWAQMPTGTYAALCNQPSGFMGISGANTLLIGNSSGNTVSVFYVDVTNF